MQCSTSQSNNGTVQGSGVWFFPRISLDGTDPSPGQSPAEGTGGDSCACMTSNIQKW